MAFTDWTQYNLGSPTVSILNSSGSVPPSDWYDGDWSSRIPITVDKSLVPSTQSNFPLLISIDVTASIATGDDILFTSSDGLTKLDHEIESYEEDSDGGHLVAWVRISLLSSSTNTTIYLYYGNPDADPQENSEDVWDSNYLLVYHLSQDPSGSSPQATDSSGNTNHGTSNGTMLTEDLVDGQINGAWDFDGMNDYISSVNLSTSIGSGDVTISFWMRTAALSSNITMFYIGSPSGNADYLAGTHLTSNEIRFQSRDGAVGNGNIVHTTNVTTDEWAYVVCTRTGTTGELFLNGSGESDTDAEWGVTVNTETTFANFRVGASTGFYEGILDEIRVSDIVRSDDWITIEYTNQNDPESFIIISDTQELINFQTSPIIGIGSLLQSGSSSLVTMVEDNYTKGLSRGVIRELILPFEFLGSSEYDVGFFFMSNVVDLTLGSGKCYTFSINSDSDISNNRVRLQYHDAGLESTPSLIFSGPEFTREDSNGPYVIALEVEWVYEPTLLNGILIIMREGHSTEERITDFSNLLEVGRVVIFEEDPLFLGVSNAEGIYMDSRGGSGNVTIVRDRTRISSLSLSS